MKRKGRFLLFVLLALALPKRAGADQWVFNKYIEIVCPWGIGGGADNTLRTIAPLLQGVLDTEVKIINVPGNGGIDGVQYVMEKPADGYCFLLGTQSMIMADLQGRMETRFKEEFVPVSRLVYSVDVIVASRAACEGRFQTFEELMQFGKEHPGEVTCGVMSQYGEDYIALMQTLGGMDVTIVPYDETVALGEDVIAGRTMLMVTGTEEVMGLIERGDVVPLIVLYEERLPMLPDVPCTKEMGIDSDMGVWRGLWARRGTPPEAIAALDEAVAQAVGSKKWNKFLIVGSYNLRPGYCNTAEFERFVENEYGRYAAFYHKRKMLGRIYGEAD